MPANNLHVSKLIRLIALTLLMIGFSRAPVSAQPFQPGHVAIAPNVPDETEGVKIDPEELEGFIDQRIADRMLTYNIPSYTVSVVQDGKIILAKGYGYADVEKQVLVSSGRTLFRIGSVGKLFVWTAVMQLVERGQLDLDADVNTYLDFQIPATYPQPITLAHLMTHTSGLDKRDQGEIVPSTDQVLPLEDYIQTHRPPRVFPPGQFHLYSNYGTNLAAYIVQRVTGILFEAYVEKRILAPLGMHHSTFRQPLPEGWEGDMAAGYQWRAGSEQGHPGEFEGILGCGSLTTNAVDMARFMLGHLGNLEAVPQPILNEETAALMHAPHFRYDPRLPGFAYGFFETERSGQRLITHAGGTLQFSANLVLMPEQGIGLFEAYSGGVPGSGFLEEAFVDHYFPPEPGPVLQPLPDLFPPVGSFQGGYRTTLMSHTTLEKVILLLKSGPKVTAHEDGTLTFMDSRWVRTEPLVFQKEGSPDLLIFRTQDGSPGGKVAYLLVGNMAYEKLPWFGYPGFQWAVLAACVLIFLASSIAWPVAWITRRRHGRQAGLVDRITAGMSWGMSAANLLFLALFVAFIFYDNSLIYGFSTLQKGAFILPLLSLALAPLSFLAAGFLSIKQPTERAWTRATRIFAMLVAGAGIAFAWLLNSWNLLGFHF